METATETLNRAIEHAKSLADYDTTHEETKEYAAEHRRLTLFLKELKAMREAWDKLYTGLTKAEQRYDEKSYKAQANRALIHRMECLEKEFMRFREVDGEEFSETPTRKGKKKHSKTAKKAASPAKKPKGSPAEGFMDCRGIKIEGLADTHGSKEGQKGSRGSLWQGQGLKGKIINLPYPSDLPVKEFIRQNYGKCFIIATGSCDAIAGVGAYTTVLLYKGKSKTLKKHRISTSSANKCMLIGVRDATLSINSSTDVIILTPAPLGFNTPKSVNFSLCQEIYQNLSEKRCSITITSCLGRGQDLRTFIDNLS